MNTLYDNYLEAETAADEAAHETGITWLIVERFPAGPVIDMDMRCLLGDAMADSEHRFELIAESVWDADPDGQWNAEVQYEARLVTA